MQLSSMMLEQTPGGRRGVTRGIAAILSADIVGYTRLMARDEEGTHARERRIRHDIINPAIADYQGRLVKHTGDGFLAVFGSPIDAVRCAIVMQRQIDQANATVPAEQAIKFRMGINIGDVIVEPEDVFGDEVNIAARLQSLAEAGDIFVSGIVHAHIKGKLDCAWASLGNKKLKNMPDPVPVYRLLPNAAAAAPARRRWPLVVARNPRAWGMMAATIVAAATSATILATQVQRVAAHTAQLGQSQQTDGAGSNGAAGSKDADRPSARELFKASQTPELAYDETLKRMQMSLFRAADNRQALDVSWSSRPQDLGLNGHDGPRSVASHAEPRRTTLPGKHCPSTALDDMLTADPQGNVFLRRGQLHAVAGEYDCAIEDFDHVLQFDPGNVNALNNRCWSRAIIGRLREALADCDEALRLRPQFSGALDSRGLALLKLGQFDQAIADYDMALRHNPQQAESWYGRGIAKLKIKDAAGARADMERAKAINPAIAEEFKRYGVRPADRSLIASANR
jgi:class 3 adenylate cyclase